MFHIVQLFFNRYIEIHIKTDLETVGTSPNAQRNILNNNSVVSEKLTNSTKKLCNDGEHSIFDLEQNGNSEFKWSEFNATCEYHLKNHSTNFDENNKPSVFKDVKGASSKNHISSKETQKKIIAGKNCNGLFNVNLKDESEYHKSCSNRNIEMISNQPG